MSDIVKRKLSRSEVERYLVEWGYEPEKVARFLNQYAENPDVWKAFEAMTLDLIARKKTAGANAILERIRWDTTVEGGKDWKVNNTFAPYYARVFVLKYPEHIGFFEFRRVQSDDL